MFPCGAEFDFEKMGEEVVAAQIKVRQFVVENTDRVNAVLNGDNPMPGVLLRESMREQVAAYTCAPGTHKKRFRQGEGIVVPSPEEVFREANKFYDLVLVWEEALRQAVPEAISDSVQAEMIGSGITEIQKGNLNAFQAEAVRAGNVINFVTVTCAEEDDFYLHLKGLFQHQKKNAFIDFFIEVILDKEKPFAERVLSFNSQEILIGDMPHKSVQLLGKMLDRLGKFKPFFMDLGFYEKISTRGAN